MGIAYANLVSNFCRSLIVASLRSRSAFGPCDRGVERTPYTRSGFDHASDLRRLSKEPRPAVDALEDQQIEEVHSAEHQ